jgi:hypothetical protein
MRTSIENACLVHYSDRVIELFPDGPDLVKPNAVSYAGVPLVKADGTVLGHLSAPDRGRRMPSTPGRPKSRGTATTERDRFAGRWRDWQVAAHFF